jgi:thymidylate synthase (FAD)
MTNSTPHDPTEPVLDRGFVSLLSCMGSDLHVVNAARVSFNKRSPDPHLSPQDIALIRYLALHEHWTPFGHCTFTLHFKMPIFVARQFMRSNVGIVYNEVSRRYVDSPPEFYEPDIWRARPASSIKQGSGGDITTITDPERYAVSPTINLRELASRVRSHAVYSYTLMLEGGVAPEMARMILPVSMYTEFWATMSLAAAARVYLLRIHPHAQWEVQQYARAMHDLIAPRFPVSWDALTLPPENPI